MDAVADGCAMLAVVAATDGDGVAESLPPPQEVRSAITRRGQASVEIINLM
jgi:hypothetical protein